MSPYPGGLELPEVETRPSCTDVWPPVIAKPNAEPVGKWTILERKDGRKQWAYDGYALYTSVLDRGPGDVFGGSDMRGTSEAGAQRKPMGPPPNIPPQFAVRTVATGHLLTIGATGRSVYYSDHDAPGKSNCDLKCLHRLGARACAGDGPFSGRLVHHRELARRQAVGLPRDARVYARWIRGVAASREVMSRAGTTFTPNPHRRLRKASR